MINLNPETLQEESREETTVRQRQTGVLANGHTVMCHPTGEEDVVEPKHRVVCLVRPYPSCSGCQHSKFTLVFNADSKAHLQQVKCPRWKNDGDRIKGAKPEYVTTEIATCAERPFGYCPSCPSVEDLSKMYIDKKKDGWYSRYQRFQEEDDD